MSSTQFVQDKQRTVDLFRSVEGIAERRNEEELARYLRASLKDFVEGRLCGVVCGDLKQGKSKLLNALLDQSEELFPVDFDPATRLVCTVEYAAKEEYTVYFGELDNLRSIVIERSRIPEFASEKWKTGEAREAKLLSVSLPHKMLEDGLVLVGTPGLDSLFEEHTFMARTFLPRADFILFVSDVQVPLLDPG